MIMIAKKIICFLSCSFDVYLFMLGDDYLEYVASNLVREHEDKDNV